MFNLRLQCKHCCIEADNFQKITFLYNRFSAPAHAKLCTNSVSASYHIATAVNLTILDDA